MYKYKENAILESFEDHINKNVKKQGCNLYTSVDILVEI